MNAGEVVAFEFVAIQSRCKKWLCDIVCCNSTVDFFDV